ncbi:hypothetical protein LTR27_005671 [Elasticomyces elasticus]|nr:hypothetical protein LTR27_005671 [Elasticomyces elasticus]
MSSTNLPMPSGPRVATADTLKYPHLNFNWAERIDYQGNDWYTWTPKHNYTTVGPAQHPTRLLTTDELDRDRDLYPNTKFEVAAIVDVLLWSGVPMNPYLRPELPGPDYKAFMADEPEMIEGEEHEKWVKNQVKEYKRNLQRGRSSPRKRQARQTDGEDVDGDGEDEELQTPQRKSRGAPRPTRYQDDEDQEEATPAASAATSAPRRTTTGRPASRTTVPWTAEMRAALHLIWLESWENAAREAAFNHVFRDQLPGRVRYSTMASQEGTRREPAMSKREKWVPAMEIVDGGDGPGLLQELKEAKEDFDANSDDEEEDDDEQEQAEDVDIDE